MWTLWTPVYWFAGSMKLLTAAASVPRRSPLPPSVPKCLELIRTAKLSEAASSSCSEANANLGREILVRKQMEEELAESEERFRSLFQNLRVGVTLSGPSGEALMCNPAALQLLGVTESSSGPHRAGRASGAGVPVRGWADWAGDQQPGNRCVKRYKPVHRPNQGDVAWLLVSSEPQLATDGSVNTVISTSSNITKRKLAEDSIVEWKNRYEAAIQASGQVLYDWNALAGEVTFGGSLVKTLGYEPQEMTGGLSRWKELIHADDRQRFTEEMDRVTETGDAIHMRFRMRRKDDRYITVQDDGYFFEDIGNRTMRMVGFIADVSERLELEEQLRQAQKMEAIGQLAGGIAHDFNNILSVIGGYSATLQEDLDPKSPLREDVEEIALGVRARMRVDQPASSLQPAPGARLPHARSEQSD